MMDLFSGFQLENLLTAERAALLTQVLVLLIIGIPLTFFLSKWSRNSLTKSLNPQRGMIAGKIIYFTGLIVVVIMVMRQLGFELGPLLGAAGIIGIAIGFASQTSVSNIISGIFLIGEQPFVVGDVIRIGTTTGIVLSVDTLSVKLRTFDNQFVRIPNENILKSEVTTITRFPIRRIDMRVSVAYKEDLARVKDVLKSIAEANPMCLQEPEPLIIFDGFGNSSVDIIFAVWAAKEDWFKTKMALFEQIKARFDAEGIEIPFPHVTLYTGAETTPFPIEMKQSDE